MQAKNSCDDVTDFRSTIPDKSTQITDDDLWWCIQSGTSNFKAIFNLLTVCCQCYCLLNLFLQFMVQAVQSVQPGYRFTVFLLISIFQLLFIFHLSSSPSLSASLYFCLLLSTFVCFCLLISGSFMATFTIPYNTIIESSIKALW